MNRLTLLCLLALFAVACGPTEVAVDAEPDEANSDEAAVAGELKAQVSGLTVWLRPELTKQVRSGRTVWVLRGRASKNLDGVSSFVFDDVLGNGHVLTARTFEVEFDDQSELNTILSGLRLFLRIEVAGAPSQSATASIFYRAKLTQFAGSTKIWLSNDVAPIENGGLTYRMDARIPSGASLQVTGLTNTVVPQTTGVAVDSKFESLRAALGQTVTFTATESTGAVRVKTAVPAVTVASLELTRADAYDTWPPVQCTAQTQACLDNLPAGTLDVEVCGEYRAVSQCDLPGKLIDLLPSPDDLTAIANATAAVNASLSAGRRVSYEVFVASGASDAAPSLDKVAAAWLAHTRLQNFTNVGAITNGAANTDLRGYGATSLVPAAQASMYSNSYRVWKVTQQYLAAPGSTRWVTFLLLQFPGMARLVVYTLTTDEL